MGRRAAPLVLAAAALGLLAGADPASAQGGRASGCILDRCQDRDDPQALGQRRSAPRPSVPGRPSASTGDFDFYVLALSWSSGFCATAGSQRESQQCRRGAGLGFVVHGLWPQYERGYPSDCDASGRPLTRQAMDIARELYPDEGLARYEWRKHGTCTGRSPLDYFSDVRDARARVSIPESFQSATQEQRIGPAEIVRAFTSANPRLRPGMMAVGCTRGVLQEVRICFSKDLRGFQACPEVVRSSCRSGDISVPPVL